MTCQRCGGPVPELTYICPDCLRVQRALGPSWQGNLFAPMCAASVAVHGELFPGAYLGRPERPQQRPDLPGQGRMFE